MNIDPVEIEQLQKYCFEKIRPDIIKAIYNTGRSGHPAGSFGIVEILVVLYKKILKVDASNMSGLVATLILLLFFLLKPFFQLIQSYPETLSIVFMTLPDLRDKSGISCPCIQLLPQQGKIYFALPNL